MSIAARLEFRSEVFELDKMLPSFFVGLVRENLVFKRTPLLFAEFESLHCHRFIDKDSGARIRLRPVPSISNSR